MARSTQPEQKSHVAAQTPADKRAQDKRKLRAALTQAMSVPQNARVLAELAKR